MMENMKGALILRVNAVLTVLFLVTAIISAIIFDQPWKAIAVAVSLGTFTVGVVAFLWGYWTAVQRSREDNISVAALYFLIDGCAPQAVARRMNLLLMVQVIGGLATALARPSTGADRGSTLAFGILVPMMGLGLNGLWGAYYGSFSPRNAGSVAEVPTQDAEIEKDGEHD
jgi:hypothetical protein